MPLRVCTGFEFGPIASLTGLIKGNSGSRIVDAGGGTPSIVSTAPTRNGGYVLELDPAGVDEYVQWTSSTLGTSQTHCVAAFAFYFPTLPTADSRIAVVDILGTVNCTLFFTSADGRVAASANDDVGTAVAGPTVAAATWYYAELYVDVSAATHTLDWWIDGVAQTQATFASSADTIGEVRLGTDIAQTMTCRYDDLAIWTDTAAISVPVGPHKVVMLRADSAGTTAQIGTANATARMVNNSTIEATHNSANIIAALRDVPPVLGATASGVGQRTSGVGNAVGIPMETYTLATGETIAGVRILVAGWAAAGQTNAIGLRVFNGTTEEILFATGNPNFDASDPCAWLCQQVAGATMFDTQTRVDNLVVRLGYSGDISPLPGAHAIYAEVAIKQAVLAIAPAAVTVSATTGTVTVAGTSPDQAITPAAVAVTATPGTLSQLSLSVLPAAVVVTATTGTIAISGTSPAQDILPAGPTVTATPGTLAVAQTIAPAIVTVNATAGAAAIGQAVTVLTESFNKADGALGPDQTWRRQITPGSGTPQWAVVSNAAQHAASVVANEDLQIPDDFPGSADQVVSVDVTELTDTTVGSYWIGAGVQVRNEPLNAAADYRAYAAEIGRNNQIFPGIDIWQITLWSIDSTQSPPNDVTLLAAFGTPIGQITLPGVLTLLVAGDQLITWFTHAGPGPTLIISTNTITFPDGRYVGLGAGHSLVAGDSASVTIDNFRAATAQLIEPDPVVVTATIGEIASVTGGASVTQHITPYADPDVIVDAGDTPVPPADIVDGGTSATALEDVFDANLTAVVVNATPGTLTVAIVQTQNITPLAVVITATPGTLTVTTGPILPVGPTVTVSAGTVTVTGGAVQEPAINLEVTISATRHRAQAEPVSSGTRSRAAATVTDQTRSRGQIEDADATRLGVLVDATRG